jgi:hypothetical protein
LRVIFDQQKENDMTNSNYIFGRIYIADGYRVGLGLLGPKWIQVVYLADGNFCKVARLPRSDARFFSPLAGYPSARKLALALLRDRRASQMTATARSILLRAKGVTS